VLEVVEHLEGVFHAFEVLLGAAELFQQFLASALQEIFDFELIVADEADVLVFVNFADESAS
jgi:hypothetical protein